MKENQESRRAATAAPIKVKIPKELRALMREGREFEVLIRQPAWAKLLDRLEQRVNKALIAMRECRSSNPRVQAAFMTTWQHAQTWYDLIQQEALTPIKLRQDAEQEVKAILTMEMGEISEERAAEMERNGVMPRSNTKLWDFVDDDD